MLPIGAKDVLTEILFVIHQKCYVNRNSNKKPELTGSVPVL